MAEAPAGGCVGATALALVSVAVRLLHAAAPCTLAWLPCAQRPQDEYFAMCLILISSRWHATSSSSSPTDDFHCAALALAALVSNCPIPAREPTGPAPGVVECTVSLLIRNFSELSLLRTACRHRLDHLLHWGVVSTPPDWPPGPTFAMRTRSQQTLRASRNIFDKPILDPKWLRMDCCVAVLLCCDL